jgi:hypothetical protein
MAAPWHVSLRPDTPPTSDTDTGEVRVPVELWTIDRSEGHGSLVLSRAEAEQLRARLSDLIARSMPMSLPAEAFG